MVTVECSGCGEATGYDCCTTVDQQYLSEGGRIVVETSFRCPDCDHYEVGGGEIG